MTPSDVARIVNKLVAPIKRRALLTIARAMVELVDDSGGMQLLQASTQEDDVRDDVEHFQEYGFGSVAFKDSETVLARVEGNSDHSIALLVIDRRYRPTGMQEGDVYMYTKANGLRLYCNAQDGSVNLGTNPSDYVALAPATKQEISNLQQTVNNIVTAYNTLILPSGMGPVGPPAVPLQPPAAVGPIAATEVKAK